ncbi:MAG: type II secretion system protein GspM [Rhodoferax sp.]|nr:type II secretion system protein GspM [Rhodoferax sp.]
MQWQKILAARWAALATRERIGLTLAAGVVGVALLWGVLIAPALRTRDSADQQMAALALQLDEMQALQARAQALQAQPVIAPQDALKALQTAAADLGKNASLLVGGETATLTLKQVSATTLAQWLSPQPGQSLLPFEVHVQQEAQDAQDAPAVSAISAASVAPATPVASAKSAEKSAAKPAAASAASASALAASAGNKLWSGTLVFRLPAANTR